MHKKVLIILVIIACASCSQPKYQKQQLKGKAQGTYYAITYYDSLNRNFQKEIELFFKEFDSKVSLWDTNSILCKINKNEDVQLDSVFIDIFLKSQQISEQTNGAFDATIAPLTSAWGFGFKEKQRLTKEKVDSLLHYVGYNKVFLKEGIIHKQNTNMSIDFNAIAKGYSVDMIGKFLASKGIKNYLVDIGGEVLAKGTKPDSVKWIVGIEKPAENLHASQQIQSKVELKDAAIATSGNYRKYYEENGIRYAHTISPKTGYPVKHSLLSVSVLAKECWLADAYATAFMVMGLDASLEFIQRNPNINAYFIYYENNTIKTYATKGFKDSIVE